MIYWMIALIVTNLILGAVIIYLIRHEDNEKKELRDRFMARDFSEYNYYTTELPDILREKRDEQKEKKKKQKREKPLTAEERELKETAEKF